MIQLLNIKKEFADRTILEDISLTFEKGKMTCVIGRSGEGKSVLLKLIIGLLKPTAGNILFDNVNIVTASAAQQQAILQQCGYVFQAAALLDSLTVFENIALPLAEQGYSHSAVLPLVKEKLALVNLSEQVLTRYPAELSGGMRKRVGLARTLITNPSIMLYDEPTTGLDPITTRIVHELMASMQQQLGLTSIVVSHDREIFSYADKVALLHNGKIHYYGDAHHIQTTDNVYMQQFLQGLSQGPLQTEGDNHILTS